MMRTFQFAALSLLVAAAAMGEEQARRGAARPAPPRAGAPFRGVVPRGGAAKAGPPMVNPANLAARLYKASPEERERALEKLPPARQAQARRQLEEFDRLPIEQQQIRIRQAEKLASLPPEKRREVTQTWRTFQTLPPDRKQAVRAALRRLQTMPDEQRARILASDQFRLRFSPDEQKIIVDLSDLIFDQ
jgi:hypothetical protein